MWPKSSLAAGEVITQLLLTWRGGQRAQVSQGTWPRGHERRRPSEDRGVPIAPGCAEPVPGAELGVGTGAYLDHRHWGLPWGEKCRLGPCPWGMKFFMLCNEPATATGISLWVLLPSAILTGIWRLIPSQSHKMKTAVGEAAGLQRYIGGEDLT